jgi:hypothetical protein
MDEYALEVQIPWSQYLLSGSKTVETRTYKLPSELLHRQIAILQTQSGTAGISALSDNVDLMKSIDCCIVGWVLFSSIKIYTNHSEFFADQHLHLVDENSPYSWKDGKEIYGWIVESCGSETSAFSTYKCATRIQRSIFQLQDSQSTIYE